MNTIVFAVFLLNSISGKIQGVIRDRDSGEPIPYANIIIQDTQLGTAADEEGNFFILNVSPGTYTVEASHIGYQTKRIKNVVVKINQTARLEIVLKQTAIQIPPITVTGRTPIVSKDMTGTTYITGKTELAALPIDYTINLIAFQPSVARLDTALHVRGGR
ncbi:MAG: carboxypeptidase-like regulatory domain-containing protein, partial [candidate division WOR-3 bacterium]